MSFDLEKARMAIAAAPLPPRPEARLGMAAPASAPAMATGTPQALVVGSDVVSFADTVGADYRQAIADGMLLAQFMANAQVPGNGDPIAWFEAYVSALSTFGWRTQANDGTTHDFKGDGLEVHQAIIQVAAAFLGAAPAAMALVVTTLNALGSMNKDSPLITLFNREAQHATAGRFQVATVHEDGAGEGGVAIDVMAFSLKADSTVTQILFFKLHVDRTALRTRHGTLALDDATMRSVAPLLRARVTAYRAAFIGAIPLPPISAD
ncbi:hypothetical protein SAMN05192583_3253 [Sphingomonas gellani]|uniref:Uncharacterized protein n=1 Tax=Sphingomonas gellani TaxID=1166340 RepID=A0A1H8IA94_9SPHN|nr:hypothetical protein [Sphingomonas gellani]SEN64966.1 hypothetical protein SAMN05192583_3253 [Sphingomonas gellani]